MLGSWNTIASHSTLLPLRDVIQEMGWRMLLPPDAMQHGLQHHPPAENPSVNFS